MDSFKYRADIDGLRALAIVPVVLFHAFPNRLPGGFIGVDVFFVISGFLISSIIFRKISEQNFSLLDFYARRVRRIFPALSLILLATLMFGWLALDADEYKILGKHAAAGVGFFQNFILWGEAGYFDTSSELKPLLHLWSLAIEEQFYLVFPIIAWLTWRMGLSLSTLAVLIAIGSLTINLSSVRIAPIETFYFPHTRIWELMAGAILASLALSSTTLAQKGDEANGPVRELDRSSYSLSKTTLSKTTLSCLGLGLIMISTLVFEKHHHYPGWRAIVPVLGTVLIIYAGQTSWINRHLLSNRLVVFVGLISYPLYLWHWPLLSFARIIESEPLSATYRLVLISFSFVLATLTYKVIEKPIRQGNYQRLWTTGLVMIMFCIGGLGIMVHKRELTSRLGASVQEVKDWEQQYPSFEDHCADIFPEWNSRGDIFTCAFTNQGKPKIAMIGDSHAQRLHYGISHFIGSEHNTAIFPIGCALPFYDISTGIIEKYRPPGFLFPKTQLINKALDFSINDPAVKLIILTTSACWNEIIDTKNLHIKNVPNIVENKMRITFERLKQSGKQVIYVLDNPILDFDPKNCISRPFRINSGKVTCKMTIKTYENQRTQYFEIVRRVLSDYPEIKVFDVASKLCDTQYCYAVIDNTLLYRDTSHLGREGSKFVGRLMLPLIKDSLKENN